MYNNHIMLDVKDATPEVNQTENPRHIHRGLGVFGVLALIAIILVVSFELVYAGKVYPGVAANGVYLGGLSQSEAGAKLANATTAYSTELLPITYNNTTLRIPLKQLNLNYDAKVGAEAMRFGRTGSITDKLHAQMRALIGKSTPISSYSFPADRLDPYFAQIADDIDTTVQNAMLTFNDNHTQVTASQTGKRVDLGLLMQGVEAKLAQTSTEAVVAPIYELAPSITTEALTAASHQADSFISSAVTVDVNGAQKIIDQPTIISWLVAKPVPPKTDYLPDFYPSLNTPSAKITLNATAINDYVAAIAKKTDQDAQNAALTIVNGAATVFQASHNGAKLDQADAVSQITNAITKDNASRLLTLKVAVTKPTISEDSLNNLGIKELLSEGKTYFPGSTSSRLTNVRVGAAKYNGILLAPGEQFSFGKILGDVGAEQGYKPELVILGDHEEKQYGGGLCQVSSTAYRAALLAGLPINQRYNHSFAISYYTAPYGVPGVDATIYYPQVDFKFTNDTGNYILIQTHMEGTTLTFDYYGTKVKSGQIRGPYFITGTTDNKQPSTTVFYRDVLDLAGNVIKTDTVNTHYESSDKYPVQKTYN
jgi:vancomycin resistance protein YoaR